MLGGIDVSIGPQDRIALLGPNGAGKSTFTKLLAGEAPPLAGSAPAAADLAIGYFAQQQLEQLEPGAERLLAPARARRSGFRERRRAERARPPRPLRLPGRPRVRAGRPGFPAARRRGSTLALLVARRPNLLLLDEPTNHLDIDMRHALTVALQSFEGGLIVVSHDRHLIKTVADTLWLVADGKLSRLRRRSRRLPAMAEVAPRRRRSCPRYGASGGRRAAQARRTPQAGIRRARAADHHALRRTCCAGGGVRRGWLYARRSDRQVHRACARTRRPRGALARDRQRDRSGGSRPGRVATSLAAGGLLISRRAAGRAPCAACAPCPRLFAQGPRRRRLRRMR